MLTTNGCKGFVHKAVSDPSSIPWLRRTVQTVFAMICLASGWQLYLFHLWATGRSQSFVGRPSAVEGFLPISALVALKQLVLTGRFDVVHPAGLTIFLSALFIAVLARKGFCGWICPVGFASNLAEAAGKGMGLLQRLPAWLDIPVLLLKYAVLGFFIYLVIFQMDIAAIEAFLKSSYNVVVDVKMLYFFLAPSFLAGCVLIFLTVISFILANFWCRYLCPYGALLGLLALASPMQVKRDTTKCIDCKRCERACPASIAITKRQTVRNCECIGCLECLAACPQKDCLSLAAPGRPKVSFLLLPVTVLFLFLVFWAVARATGHWQSAIPLATLKQLYAVGANLAHPGL